MDLVFTFSSKEIKKIWEDLSNNYFSRAWVDCRFEMTLISRIIYNAIKDEEEIENGGENV